MTTACFVPSLCPNLWHLGAIMHADKVWYLTDEPFSRKSNAHRMQLRTQNGTQWFTLPVRTEDKKKPLNEVRLDLSGAWNRQLMKVLQTNYGNSIFYDFYEPEIRDDLQKAAAMEKLLDVVLYLNKRIYRYLELDNLIQDRVNLAKTAGFEKWINGKGDALRVWIEPRGRYYRKLGEIKVSHIEEPELKLPEYRQHFEGFEPGCCLLDLLFQYGPLSFTITDQITP